MAETGFLARLPWSRWKPAAVQDSTPVQTPSAAQMDSSTTKSLPYPGEHHQWAASVLWVSDGRQMQPSERRGGRRASTWISSSLSTAHIAHVPPTKEAPFEVEPSRRSLCRPQIHHRVAVTTLASTQVREGGGQPWGPGDDVEVLANMGSQLGPRAPTDGSLRWHGWLCKRCAVDRSWATP